MKISVCMATYNGEKYIKEQIETILPQLSVQDELIISDDSSTDQTLEIVKVFNDPRIKIFDQQKFKSPIFNFENAIKHATGDYIFLSDQDDIWLPDKIQIMLRELKQYDLVLSNCYIGDTNLKIIKDSYFEWRNSKKGIIKNLKKNSYLGCCMGFNKKILKKILPFPAIIPMHDMWIGMIAEIYFKPCFIQNKLMIYRRHESNATILNEDFKSKESLRKKIGFRINLLIALIQRAIWIY